MVSHLITECSTTEVEIARQGDAHSNLAQEPPKTTIYTFCYNHEVREIPFVSSFIGQETGKVRGLPLKQTKVVLRI